MYSKYVDNSKNQDGDYRNIEEIINNILDYENWRDNEIDTYTSEPLDYSINKYFDENKKATIKESDFEYNYFEYKFDSLMKGQEQNPIFAERIKTTSGFFVIYTDGMRTQYLIDKARGSNALKILRKFNNSDKNKIIEAQAFVFESDFFLWLVSKFKNDNNIDEVEELVLKSVTGFKGLGNQNQATLTGSGNDVMNLFSTLSFIIEMESLTEILAQFQHRKNTYEIRFYENNSQIDINIDNYTGDYVKEEETLKKSIVLLHCFIEIIPSVINSYNNDVDNNDWSKDKKGEFSTQILEAVKENIEKIEQTIAPKDNGAN